MARKYWQPSMLIKAAQLLTDASRNLHTSFPNSNVHPEPATIPAVMAMIESALECIKLAQPTEPRP